MTKLLTQTCAPDSWFDALDDLALACAGAFAEDEGVLLRRFHGLLEHAPSPALLAGIAQPDAALFDASVSLGAATSAALSLIGEDAGYMLSRDSSGKHLASIILPGHFEEATVGADTAALAIVGALAVALHDPLPLPADLHDIADRTPVRLN
ncbi:hypothetical protein [Novosphingobium sp.]|uniref:hypothetical protein n=1 Tax=Novosphingobium sp. TaxID=1874826 RepID=UPI00286E655A|nr:hypothetical protein [Novosphingobium sp.]